MSIYGMGASGALSAENNMKKAQQSVAGKRAAGQRSAAAGKSAAGQRSAAGKSTAGRTGTSTAWQAGNGFAEQVNSVLDVKTHIVYTKTDDMLYSGGNGTGLSYYIKYAENSTEDDPTVVAKGVDEYGNDFEQTIHINKINPECATIVEMRALEAYLGVDKNGGLSSLPPETGRMGLHDRADFMKMFQKQISDMRLLRQGNTAAYYQYSMQKYADFMNRKSGSSKDSGDSNEKAFASVGANAPDAVRQAWMAAAAAAGVNGLGMSANGMLTHLTAMMVQRAENWMNEVGGTDDLLGNTVQSAIRAASQALYDLDHPLSHDSQKSLEVQRQQMKERAFYQAFLDHLINGTTEI